MKKVSLRLEKHAEGVLQDAALSSTWLPGEDSWKFKREAKLSPAFAVTVGSQDIAFSKSASSGLEEQS